METINFRLCKKCGLEKPETEFHKVFNRKLKKEHRRFECKNCAKEYAREWARKNKDRVNKRKKENYDPKRASEIAKRVKQKNPIRYLLKVAKSRAKMKGVPFCITEEDLQPVPLVCPVLGVPLRYYAPRTDDENSESASIDRLIPELGYVPGNVAIISRRANTLKNNATVKELELVIDWLKKQ